MKKIKLYFLKKWANEWLKENKEPLWTKGYTHNPQGKPYPHYQEYKEWCIRHSDWVRSLERYLGIYRGY
jgi:hypothetical protein